MPPRPRKESRCAKKGEHLVPKIRFNGQSFDVPSGKTVLDTLLDNGQNVSCGCKSGNCQACALRARGGAVPPSAQRNLTDAQREDGVFLPCCCEPTGDLDICELADRSRDRAWQAVVTERNDLSDSVVRIAMSVPDGFEFRGGQFITIRRDEEQSRPYSIASVGGIEARIDLHVRRVENGDFSRWLCDEVNVGDRLAFTGPGGGCHYRPGRPNDGLLLIATGTGLAPLWAVLRDAMYQGHRGPMRLYHAGRDQSSLYMIDTLRTMAASRPNFQYMPVLKEATAKPGFRVGTLEQVVGADFESLDSWRVYIAGNPDMVRSMQKLAFLKGVRMNDLIADPFVRAAVPARVN